MILGAVLHIYTDHLNITTNNTTPDHIIQWLIYDELFNPYIHFIPGKDNVISQSLFLINGLEESDLPKISKFLFSKIPFLKEWTLLVIHFSWSVSYIYHPLQSVIQIQLTINEYLLN